MKRTVVVLASLVVLIGLAGPAQASVIVKGQNCVTYTHGNQAVKICVQVVQDTAGTPGVTDDVWHAQIISRAVSGFVLPQVVDQYALKFWSREAGSSNYCDGMMTDCTGGGDLSSYLKADTTPPSTFNTGGLNFAEHYCYVHGSVPAFNFSIWWTGGGYTDRTTALNSLEVKTC